jgi:putative pyruvate formate lyase activating enzyme
MNKAVKHRFDYPSYIALSESEELEERICRAYALMESCTVCPRKCRIKRLDDERGFCRTGLLPVISSFGPHFGEEPPLVGQKGSGTIFVTHCNLSCEYCQNYNISQCGNGEIVSCETLAGMMIHLQQRNCHNINLVTPSHVVPQIIRSIGIAAEQGLHIPIVYNCGGYDSVDTLQLLEGIVDIYMPDDSPLSRTGICCINESSNERNASSGWRSDYKRWFSSAWHDNTASRAARKSRGQ